MAAKKTTKKTGTKGGSKPSYDFCIAALKENKNVEFATVRDAAAKKSMTLYPIVYGRAKAALGLVPVAKYGQSKKRKQAATEAPTRRGPGRPKGSKNKKARRSPGRPRSTLSGLQDFVTEIKNIQQERDAAIRTLEKIRDLIDTAV